MKIKNPIYLLFAFLFLFGCKKENPQEPVPPVKSAEKKITSFKFTSITPQVDGVIDELNKKITVGVPYGTVITSLLPVITVSDKAKIENTAPADFSKTVTYKVTAEDGTSQDYQVVTKINSPIVTFDTYTGPTQLEAGNSTLLIKGKGFGTNASNIQVWLTNTTTGKRFIFSSFTTQNDSNIEIAIPETLELTTYAVKVIIADVETNLPIRVNIVYATPVLESVNKTSFAQGESLVITGRFFSTDPNLLFVTLKSKANPDAVYLAYPNKANTLGTSTRMEFPLTMPGGTYTVQVNSNNKLSAATRDIEIIAPTVIKPTVVKINKSNNGDGLLFYVNNSNTIELVVKNINSTSKTTIYFESPDGNSSSAYQGTIKGSGTEGVTVAMTFILGFTPGNYRVSVEQNGKRGDPSTEIITVR